MEKKESQGKKNNGSNSTDEGQWALEHLLLPLPRRCLSCDKKKKRTKNTEGEAGDEKGAKCRPQRLAICFALIYKPLASGRPRFSRCPAVPLFLLFLPPKEPVNIFSFGPAKVFLRNSHLQLAQL